ncbi:MAG: Pyruvate formate-lyase 1-activating enzyme [Eubacteriales bacterium]|jgi:pyruvate formate lyase activating enzyme
MKTVCEVCPHFCNLQEGQTGFCRARSNEGGKIVCKNYGRLTALALDPIEKKPLQRFYPGSRILSVGSYGCNLRCPFCQNCEISMADGEQIETVEVSPAALVGKALELLPRGNIGIAYTYNEPLVGYEYVRDCAKLAKEHSLKNVVVTNGNINEKPLQALLPDIDAMNIDLKGFTERFYTAIGGNLETVKRSIQIAAERCHVEVTTLVIPGENDSVEEMDALSRWLAGVSPEIPLHVSRFFPRWRMTDRGPTPVETIDCLAETARKNLRYVYKGNC